MYDEYIIDLHGCNVEQAISKIILGLANAENNSYDCALIITGKGTGAMKTVVEEYLHSEGLEFELIREGNYLIPIYYQEPFDY
ncbi:hypothetical protein MCFN_01970 [Mycoplasmopsis californica]|uniref:Smr domain-containing protein n=1 Tax=Mycoplasmopsis californica TaxID=2113 RepID=A0A059XR54_9BACT|nr:Smr/MutS family protein [Mycoplasmopsis californica]AIA29535.1 hypothetical protein MCFN_01970 [Mycoplasmopsis californica]